jgi:2-amino-4-hydroxy-6-hydroxymethyldihydropteridine diphosphokinase
LGSKISIQRSNKKPLAAAIALQKAVFDQTLQRASKYSTIREVSVVRQAYHYIMKRVFLLLGSNQGNRKAALEKACHLLSQKAGEIKKTSALYRTAAWGNTDQPDFFNQAIEIATPLSPDELLNTCLETESQMGRQRLEKWGERLIDIDILFYDNVVLQHEALQIPHPHIPFRRFTLVPLAEIAPDFVHPSLDKPVRQLLDECKDPLPVDRIQDTIKQD